MKKAYDEALSSGDLPANAVQVVTTQAIDIKAAHDQIKALRNTANL
ncbi:ferritin family protein [Mucilaginibacter pedocola]|nr:hypothetical protein [Mucilaginibacter pedocola]